MVAQGRRPVQVVDHGRGVVAGEVEERLDLRLRSRPTQVATTSGSFMRALARLARVADQAGGAADQGERAMARELEASGGQHLHEVAEVQARRGRVEADVERHRPGVQRRPQLGPIGGLLEQPAPLEVVEDVAHGGDPPVRRPPGRYGLTVGSPVTQRRQGLSTALVSPTRGPLDTAESGTGSPAVRRTDAPSRHRSAPSCSRPRPSADVSRPAPGELRVVAGGHPPGAGDLEATDDDPGAKEHRGGEPVRPADDVGAPVHAIAEIDVEEARRSEHHGVAGCDAAVRV